MESPKQILIQFESGNPVEIQWRFLPPEVRAHLEQYFPKQATARATADGRAFVYGPSSNRGVLSVE